MTRIVWSASASADFEAIVDHLLTRSRQGAATFVNAVDRGLALLADHPLAAPRRGDVRELVLRRLPYILAYRVTTNGLEVLAIHHGARERPGA